MKVLSPLCVKSNGSVFWEQEKGGEGARVGVVMGVDRTPRGAVGWHARAGVVTVQAAMHMVALYWLGTQTHFGSDGASLLKNPHPLYVYCAAQYRELCALVADVHVTGGVRPCLCPAVIWLCAASGQTVVVVRRSQDGIVPGGNLKRQRMGWPGIWASLETVTCPGPEARVPNPR